MKLDGTGKVVKQRELKPARKYRVTTLERFGDGIKQTIRMLTPDQIVKMVAKRKTSRVKK